MMARIGCRAVVALFVLLSPGFVNGQSPGVEDETLAAMRAELERAQTLRIEGFPPPYFLEFRVEDVDNYSASASLGALIQESRARFRLLGAQVRVGSYEFDNTNYVFTDMAAELPAFSPRLPWNTGPELLRRGLWLAADSAYKSALNALARKRAALRNLSQSSSLPDFWKMEPVRFVGPLEGREAPTAQWQELARKLSAVFTRYDQIQQSHVSLNWDRSVARYVNSEGTLYRDADNIASLRILAYSQAADGMPVRMCFIALARAPEDLPTPEEAEAAAQETAVHLTALAAAPLSESYTGPVLFEPLAAAQILADLLRTSLAPIRKPVAEPGRPVQLRDSEFQGRIGVRVMPEWMTVVDDPTQTEWRGRRLFGSYAIDWEGVKPAPLVLVENGILKNLYLTRQPVAGFAGSNGHARLPGAFGASRALPGNLFIQASKNAPLSELKRRLVEMAVTRGRSYGLLVRRMDFPSIATLDTLRQMAATSRSAGEARPVSQPLLVYRIYPDGREELVRGLEFRRLDTRALRDIVAASRETARFDYMDNGAALSMPGAGSYVVGVTVVSPGLLFEDLELEAIREDWQKPPLVPPPPAVR